MNILGERIIALYHLLHAHFGHEPHWWPIHSATPQFEIMIGAVLVQQTRWETVEAAVVRLRDAGLLSPAALAAADTAGLAALIRPCAFHTQKAPGLQAICRYLLERCDGDLTALFMQERAALRAELLALPRIGRETADAIMLYAGGHPTFIVDAYARRLFARVNMLPGFDFMRARYDDVQHLIENAVSMADCRLQIADFHLPAPVCDSQSAMCNFYRNFHALITEACIHHCLAHKPHCDLPGARRSFVDPRKCAEHCLSCEGCPALLICTSYQENHRDTKNTQIKRQ
jgi:endonuclease-3 related protein